MSLDWKDREIFSLKHRIKELEELICPEELHDWREIHSTDRSTYYVCNDCKKIRIDRHGC